MYLMSDTFHRLGDEYRTPADWGRQTPPDVRRRIALALGPEPIVDARHLLAPITLPRKPEAAAIAAAPDTATDFVVNLSGQEPVTLFDLWDRLTTDVRVALGFPRLWGRAPGVWQDNAGWFPIAAFPDGGQRGEIEVGEIALVWPLTGLPTEGRAAVHELLGFVSEAQAGIATPLGWTVAVRQSPTAAAAQAARWNRIKLRFAHAVELRLAPVGKPLSTREIWRSAYALGLTWGDMDLFHWWDSAGGTRLFTVSSVGQPGYFLPERAAEGERVPGIALGFELPTARAPLETYDRMAIALDYFRQQIGGRPVTALGRELDAEQLEADRGSLEEAVTEMIRAGIPPGSPEVVRFF